MKLGVVILAAGASRRMGRPKLLLPWAGCTILGHLVRTWRKLDAAQITVVLAAATAARVEKGIGIELDRVGIAPGDRIENPQPELGMFSSVRCAARWTGWQPGLTHWLLTLGDQPQVEYATLQALLEFAARHPDQVCQPARRGRPRHPVLLPRDHFEEVASTRAGDLKQFLLERPDRRHCFESGDGGLDFDLDEPADYERAVREWAARRTP